MVRKLIGLAVLGCLWSTSVQACDACACSTSGYGLGLMTAYRSNFVRLSWQLATFRANEAYGASSKDAFHTLDLAARYHLGDRVKVLLNQSYRFNLRDDGGEQQALKGLGDTRLMVSYTLLKSAKLGEDAQLFLELGGGVKLPTGAYNPRLLDEDLPQNFNVGNGSWGYVVQPNLVLNMKTFGVAWASSYQHHGATKSGYQFGHQASSQLSVFWEHALQKSVFVPTLGVQAEWITKDQYANGKAVHGTGGSGWYTQVGLNLKSPRWLYGVSYAHPIQQDYSEGEIDAQARVACQVSYIF